MTSPLYVDPLASPDPLKSVGSGSSRSNVVIGNLIDVASCTGSSRLEPLHNASPNGTEDEDVSNAMSGDMSRHVDYGTIGSTARQPTIEQKQSHSSSTPGNKPAMHAATVSGPILMSSRVGGPSAGPRTPTRAALPSGAIFGLPRGSSSSGAARPPAPPAARAAFAAASRDDARDVDEDDTTTTTSVDAGDESFTYGGRTGPSARSAGTRRTSGSGNTNARRTNMSFKRRAGSASAAGVGTRPCKGGSSPGNHARDLLHRASFGLFSSPATAPGSSSSAAAGSAEDSRVGAARGGNRASSVFSSLHRSIAPRNRAAAGDGGEDSRFDENFLNGLQNTDGHGGGEQAKPFIPPMIPSVKSDPYSTPIPTLPFVVLCLTIFGEFSSAGVAGPFLFFMIEDFNVGVEAEVGFWAGIVASAFFFAQFLTSMLWASVAEKHGRRSVLLVSLVGNATSLVLFGMATNLPTALSVRLAQGLFNGAVGVAKGAVRDLTDETNEGRAYAIMGFCWGMGGIIGPILGGLLEHPVQKYPAIFGNSYYFSTYPYLLPCIVAASFMTLGAFLALFIGPDGGPRTGAISLPEKIDIERASYTIASNAGSLGRSASKRISGYFSKQDTDEAAAGAAVAESTAVGSTGVGMSHTSAAGTSSTRQHILSSPLFPRTFTQQVDYETGGPPSPVESDVLVDARGSSQLLRRPRDVSGSRPFSRTDFRRQGILSPGSAYGYDQRRISRASGSGGGANVSFGDAGLAGGVGAHGGAGGRPHSQWAGSVSGISANLYAPDFEELGATPSKPELNFAQRFLLANDDAVLSITDLWVAAAINGDDTYSAIDEDVFLDDEDEEDVEEDASEMIGDETEDSTGGARFGYADIASNAAEDSPLLAPRHLLPLNFAQRKSSRGAYSDATGNSGGPARARFARRSSSGTRVPSLYANSGLERPISPMALLSPSMQGAPTLRADARAPAFETSLAGIPESKSASMHAAVPSAAQAQPAAPSSASIFGLLPLVIIAHYGIMSWHSSTFEQVFMAFLVTPYSSGGLGLTAAHYAELIAAMAFCQMFFQFVFYPKVGPPAGRFSHLAMLRIGLAIYLPCYILFPFLRKFLHPSTDLTVMSGMILFAAIRWLANVTAFTAITVLMNAMTPPHLVPLANGLAQTTSSAARFIGPICGGMVWAKSIEGGVEAHLWPFNYHLGFWTVGIIAFAGFLHSWTIR